MGPSGSGKTYTALTLAKRLAEGGTIACIDTEANSASLYAGSVADFDSCSFDSYNPKLLVVALAEAATAGYAVIVIDSLSHFWSGKDGIRDQVDARGGRFDAWRHATPIHDGMIKAILEYPGHVIACLRSKVSYQVEQTTAGGRTSTAVRKIGLAPVQREGLEFEFDVVATLENPGTPTLTVTKSRCSALAGACIREPGAEVANTLLTWLDGGEPATAPPVPTFDAGAIAAEELMDAKVDLVSKLDAAGSFDELDAITNAIKAEGEALRGDTDLRDAYARNRARIGA